MSWKCEVLDVVGSRERELENPPVGFYCRNETVLILADGRELSYDEMPIGSMLVVPEDSETRKWPWYWARPATLSEYYHINNSHRRPILVKLPGRSLFCVDGKCWNEQGSYGGWQVTGDAPFLTVSPSINIVGSYHGWLREGVLSDDCEGRFYDAKGYKV